MRKGIALALLLSSGCSLMVMGSKQPLDPKASEEPCSMSMAPMAVDVVLTMSTLVVGLYALAASSLISNIAGEKDSSDAGPLLGVGLVAAGFGASAGYGAYKGDQCYNRNRPRTPPRAPAPPPERAPNEPLGHLLAP